MRLPLYLAYGHADAHLVAVKGVDLHVHAVDGAHQLARDDVLRVAVREDAALVDDEGLVGIWFQGAVHFGRGLEPGGREGEHPFLSEAERWLDCYFSGHEPEFQPPIHWSGTPFQQTVWGLLRQIPYGATITYGELAVRAAEQLGRPGMSAQAVGGAVARNPISVLVPCHRVVGADGSLTGYAGGLERKRRLLDLEAAGRTCPDQAD